LREYKTVIDCGSTPCRFDMVPTMVKVNPYGELWNEDKANGASPDARAQALQASLVEPSVASSLGNGHLMGIGYPVEVDLDTGQSFSQRRPSIGATFPDHYTEQFHAATGSISIFRNNLEAAALGQGLTADQFIHRAQTQSCGGCHRPSSFGLSSTNALGPLLTPSGTLTTTWPDANGFTHVAVSVSSPPELANPVVFGSGTGHTISAALTDVFLPERRNFLVSQLNMARCACQHSFRFLVPDRARQLLDVQEKVFTVLQPEFEAVRKDSFALRQDSKLTPSAKRAFEDEAKALDDEIDKALEEQLSNTQVLPKPPTLAAQVLMLDSARDSGGKPEIEAAARQKAILDIEAAEPPSRSVTGSFTVH
jgi:hypothetical protein